MQLDHAACSFIFLQVDSMGLAAKKIEGAQIILKLSAIVGV
jgi:hypothetical protein